MFHYFTKPRSVHRYKVTKGLKKPSLFHTVSPKSRRTMVNCTYVTVYKYCNIYKSAAIGASGTEDTAVLLQMSLDIKEEERDQIAGKVRHEVLHMAGLRAVPQEVFVS